MSDDEQQERCGDWFDEAGMYRCARTKGHDKPDNTTGEPYTHINAKGTLSWPPHSK